MLDQLLNEPGKLFFDLLTRHAPPHGGEVDEREIPRRAHHHVGDLGVGGCADRGTAAVGEPAAATVGSARPALEETSHH